MSNIVDGRAIADKILEKVKAGTVGKPIRLAMLWAGDDPAVGAFVQVKTKAAFNLGMEVIVSYIRTEKEMRQRIEALSKYPGIDGIAVELPLPKEWNREAILDLIPLEKDTDILSQAAQTRFYEGKFEILPPAVGALEALLNEHRIPVKGKTVAVFGQSILIGKPISFWLEKQGAKVFRIDENTSNPKLPAQKSDIIVSGVGKPGLITAEMIKDGAVVIDFGFEKINGKIAGDVAFEEAAKKASLITPVPGGMGPIVVAAFLANAGKIEVK